MITFSDVTKRFGDTVALENISFYIEPGELVTLTGASGSGKTTVMRLLTKEIDPDIGEVMFENQPLSKVKWSQVHNHRRKIGVVFQDYKLLEDLNVWENIALALSIIGTSEAEIEQRVTDLLNLVNLPEKAYLFPHQLSGGEAQRISIARALSTAPEVVFADEPTGNLDPKTSAGIIDLLRKINALGTTIMITTHDPQVLDLLKKSRHLELEKGKLISDSHKKTQPDQTEKSESADLPPEEKSAVDKKSKKTAVDKKNLESTHKNKKNDSDHEQFEKKTASEKPTETKKPRSALKLNLPSMPKFSWPFKSKQPIQTKTSIETLENDEDAPKS